MPQISATPVVVFSVAVVVVCLGGVAGSCGLGQQDGSGRVLFRSMGVARVLLAISAIANAVKGHCGGISWSLGLLVLIPYGKCAGAVGVLTRTGDLVEQRLHGPESQPSVSSSTRGGLELRCWLRRDRNTSTTPLVSGVSTCKVTCPAQWPDAALMGALAVVLITAAPVAAVPTRCAPPSPTASCDVISPVCDPCGAGKFATRSLRCRRVGVPGAVRASARAPGRPRDAYLQSWVHRTARFQDALQDPVPLRKLSGSARTTRSTAPAIVDGLARRLNQQLSLAQQLTSTSARSS